MLKIIFQRAAVVAALCTAMVGTAAADTWYLSGVAFNDGSSASGSFDYDASTATVNAFNLSTTAGVLPAFTYDTSNSYVSTWLMNNLSWVSPAGNRYLALTFTTALTNGGGTVDLRTGPYSSSGSWECDNCAIVRTVTDGSVSTIPVALSAVPEVETYALLMAGLGLIGAAARRRKLSPMELSRGSVGQRLSHQQPGLFG